jgi:hypothetical protein
MANYKVINGKRVYENTKVIGTDGEEIDLDELLAAANEPKVEKKEESVDWLSMSNKLTFREYHELRAKHGLE